MSGGMRSRSESGQGVPPGFRLEFGGWPDGARRVALTAGGPQAPFMREESSPLGRDAGCGPGSGLERVEPGPRGHALKRLRKAGAKG